MFVFKIHNSSLDEQMHLYLKIKVIFALNLLLLFFFLFLFLSVDLSAKRKIEKKREKVLFCDSILARNPFVQAVSSSINKKSKKKPEEASKAKEISEDGAKVGMIDLWDDIGAFSPSLLL